MLNDFDTAGWALVTNLVDVDTTEALGSIFQSDSSQASSHRNVLAVAQVRRFAASPTAQQLAASIVGPAAQAVRGILFDKRPGANWGVAWHQDQVIAVAERHATPGFTAWSDKAGVVHVKPPTEILTRMVTLRVHLDDCPADNGALRVLTGSHRRGRLSSEQIAEELSAQAPTACVAARGDALLMRPLLLHASGKAASPRRRRVLHLEYAADPLPGDLRWPDWAAVG